jgi:ATP-dependent Lon protease
MFTALASLLTTRPVRSDVAMTGEISLRGLVLPIGGVKEKVLAALRAGITTVMLPARNRRDLEDIPAEARDKIKFVWLDQVEDALSAALSAAPSRQAAIRASAVLVKRVRAARASPRRRSPRTSPAPRR